MNYSTSQYVYVGQYYFVYADSPWSQHYLKFLINNFYAWQIEKYGKLKEFVLLNSF